MARIGLKQAGFVSIGGLYGLDQGLLASKWSKYFVFRACGVAALGNAILYHLQKFTLTTQEGTELLNTLMEYLRPRPWGIASINRLNGALDRLGQKWGQSFHIDSYRGKTYGTEALNYLYENLKEDRPILVLNTNHPIKAFQNHWITITGLSLEKSQSFVYFSSWGKRYKLPFDELFTDNSLYRKMGVLVTYKKEEK